MEHVCSCMPTQILRKINWSFAIVILKGPVRCGLMSDLVLCNHRNEYGFTCHRMSLLRSDIIKQCKLQMLLWYMGSGPGAMYNL